MDALDKNRFQQQNFIYGIERAILSSYLFADMHPDYSLIVNHKINTKLFTTNITIKAVARAIEIFQEEDKPLDEMLISNFIGEKMNFFDYDEYITILTSNSLPFTVMIKYEELLEKKAQDKVKGDIYARI